MKFLELVEIGGANKLGVLRSCLLAVDERALKVNAWNI